MPDYQKMYTLLFNAITDALRKIDALQVEEAKQQLILAQQQTEELYITAAEV